MSLADPDAVDPKSALSVFKSALKNIEAAIAVVGHRVATAIAAVPIRVLEKFIKSLSILKQRDSEGKSLSEYEQRWFLDYLADVPKPRNCG
ncbi:MULTISPECIES: hypothetical protein [unclassified Coleofasciculus]|uniref:hypothetical protein n=1 Tax=unclassified Coleofasciculus TaxID=2692782 RepID=UPI00187F02A1|nr:MULTISPECIES: hypothetical protein [unclassified Coleofasciculus]MBE9129144.1 hypothetical protein [Coleofasciculus sp. LEGE 07081]MBE9149523.1 hypothetical protein [Coleofasciculus sp. LEGE 07092]